MDLDFDQLDLVHIQIASKHLSGEAATWREGDWNGAPGGSQGSPPEGDELFNQLDIIAALTGGKYLTGPYRAIQTGGKWDDEQTSIVYNTGTGEVAANAPSGKRAALSDDRQKTLCLFRRLAAAAQDNLTPGRPDLPPEETS